MNSLTTVGGTVIDAADMQFNTADQPAVDKPLLLLPAASRRASRTAGRWIVGRGRSVGEANQLHHHPEPSPDDADADIDGALHHGPVRPSSAKARAAASLDRVPFSRHRSAPVTNDSRVAATDDGKSTHRPRSYLTTTRASPHFKNTFAGDEALITDEALRLLSDDNSQTIPQFPSSSCHDKNKQSIVSTLHEISKSDPYASSDYFRQLFTNGIRNVEKHNSQENGELKSVYNALRICFGTNEDMVRAIAAACVDIAEKKCDKEETTVDEIIGVNRSAIYNMKPKMDTPVSSADQTTRHNEYKPSSAHQSQAHLHSQFLTPTDLSGYTRKNYSQPNGGPKTPKPNPVHALALPLPPTPLNYGKTPTPSSHTPYCESSTTYHFDEVHNKPAVDTPSSHSKTNISFSASHGHADDVTNQSQQEACSRVQQYLQHLEERIESVKKGHTATVVVQRRDQNRSSSGSSERPRHHAETEVQSTTTRPRESVEEWNGVEPEINSVVKSTVTKQLLLPSLLSPGYKNNGGKDLRQTLVSFRDNHVVNETEMDIPLDETDGPPPRRVQKDVYRADASTVGLSQHGNSSISLICNADVCNSEEKVRAAEKSVGLKSLQEYKQLLQERTMELEGLEHKYKTQLEQAERELVGQDEQVKQFRLAMKEAEVTVVALEETIQSLEAAVNEKDELIAQLKNRVKSLETELEQSQATKLEGEIQHLESVTLLNESISQLGMDIKGRETSLFELQAKTTGLEAELAKAIQQLASSQTELAEAQKCIVEKDIKLQVSENEVLTTKEMLHGHIDLYKNEISLSLQNTTRLMDLMTKEKDSLIESLNAKIAMLEESLAEVEEEKEASSKSHDAKEKELNEKINTLAVALTKKDEQIALLRKENKKSSSRRRRSVPPSSHNHNSRKKEERLDSQHRHRNHHDRRMSRSYYVPITKEEYYEPRHEELYEGKQNHHHPYDHETYYEHNMPIITREREEEEDILYSLQHDDRFGNDEQHYPSMTSPRASRYYNHETRDDDDDEEDMMMMMGDAEYGTRMRHRHSVGGGGGGGMVDDVPYPHSSADEYTFDGDDSIYNFS